MDGGGPSSPTSSGDILTDVPRNEYMKALWQLLKDKTLMDMCLLSTHDSLTYDLSCTLSKHDIINSMVASMGNTLLTHRTLHYLRQMGRAQILTIREQFEAGVRFFDVRASLVRGMWYSVHSFNSKKPIGVYLTELAQVMRENDHEVCMVTISRHGEQSRPKGTDLDKMKAEEDLWTIITDSLEDLLVDQSMVSFRTATLEDLVRSTKRLFLFIDGWEAIAKGSGMAGHTSDLCHVGTLLTDLSSVHGNKDLLLRYFTTSCDKMVKQGKYCYVGLNSANSTMAVVRAVFKHGPKLMRMISRKMHPTLDMKLVAMGADPGTLLSYAQLSLYYAQHSLMEVLERIDSNETLSLPQAVQTDALTYGGHVRVGWLGLGVESDIQGSAAMDIEELDKYDAASTLKVHPKAKLDAPMLGLKLGEDIQPSCRKPNGKPTEFTDAARLSFDMFRFCFALSLTKYKESAKDPSQSRFYLNLYSDVRNNICPTYVEIPSVGLTWDLDKVL